jgi:predicted  nucleic acid-binding Zn-ribbon protein
MRDAATWAALIAAFGAIIAQIVQWRKTPSEVRHTEITSDLLELDGARQLLEEFRREREDMRKEMEAMRVELKSTRDELTTAEYRIFKLEQWVRAQGTDPASLYG